MRVRNYSLRGPDGEISRVAEPFPSALEGGDPFSSEQALTVSELTRRIQDLLEENFPGVLVEGEVSELKYHTSGHVYLTLKDSQSQLKAVIWRSTAALLKFRVEPGMQAVCRGRIGLYPQRGTYQLYVDSIEPKGMGALQLAFEQLKEKLQKEGLFAEERKRPLPVFPERIGLVTSPQGAAIDDILKVLGDSGLEGKVRVTLYPSRVQGNGAAEALARGIRELNARDDLDLLIVGRGGGSLEDLWAFNEEEVARSIFKSRLAVISAVGHEKDVTISDLVADLRAPTPTKAAEMVLAQRRGCFDRLSAVLDEPIFTEPREWLKELDEQVEELEVRLAEGLQQPLLLAAHRLQLLQGDLLACSPQAFLLHQSERLHRLRGTLDASIQHLLRETADRVHGLAGRLNALSPLAVLDRGYSITFNEQGDILKKASQVKPDDRLRTRLHEGEIHSKVEKADGV